jgi:indole-3-glycerol phosphate synthase
MRERSLQRADGLNDPTISPVLARAAEMAAPPIELHLDPSGFDVIAEVKLASPAEGRLVVDASPAEIVSLARRYEVSGAAAISVLTEPSRFAGSSEHLGLVADAVELPVMAKDFIVDPIQVVEARSHGASGVLLIARLLEDDELEKLTDLTLGMGMFALIEVFDHSDLRRAGRVFDRNVMGGVNTRDLKTLAVDRERLGTLAHDLPEGRLGVAESGITTAEDVAEVVALGYSLALVGTALVVSDDPGAKLRELLAAGRSTISAARV